MKRKIIKKKKMPMAENGYNSSYPLYNPYPQGEDQVQPIPGYQWQNPQNNPGPFASYQGDPNDYKDNSLTKKSQGISNFANQASNTLNDITGTARDIAKGVFFGGNSIIMGLLGPEREARLDNPYQRTTYNPRAYGTGSQAIYADGGNIDGYHNVNYKKHNIGVSYEEPDMMASSREMVLSPANSTKPITTPQVTYDKQYDITTDKEFYVPRFHNYDYQGAMNILNNNQNFPQQFGGVPVDYTPSYFKEAYNNVNQNTNSNQWRDPEPQIFPYFAQGGQLGGNLASRKDGGYNDYNLLPAEYGKEIVPIGKDGIHINPKNKGKFNALKKRTGKTTEELKHSKNPLTRRRATFAANAAKWNHKKGEYGLQVGQEVDLSQDEINDLMNQGYQFDFQ